MYEIEKIKQKDKASSKKIQSYIYMAIWLLCKKKTKKR